MSPLMMRFTTVVGIALAAASMQMKARADAPQLPALSKQQAPASVPVSTGDASRPT
jgi:hypothetical protein